jgi:hypothetical protein
MSTERYPVQSSPRIENFRIDAPRNFGRQRLLQSANPRIRQNLTSPRFNCVIGLVNYAYRAGLVDVLSEKRRRLLGTRVEALLVIDLVSRLENGTHA